MVRRRGHCLRGREAARHEHHLENCEPSPMFTVITAAPCLSLPTEASRGVLSDGRALAGAQCWHAYHANKDRDLLNSRAEQAMVRRARVLVLGMCTARFPSLTRGPSDSTWAAVLILSARCRLAGARLHRGGCGVLQNHGAQAKQHPLRGAVRAHPPPPPTTHTPSLAPPLPLPLVSMRSMLLWQWCTSGGGSC